MEPAPDTGARQPYFKEFAVLYVDGVTHPLASATSETYANSQAEELTFDGASFSWSTATNRLAARPAPSPGSP